MSNSPIPAGYHTVSPYLAVSGARAVIDFMKHVFDATEVAITEGEGRVMNAEIRVGTSMVMVADAKDAATARPGTMYLYVADPDAHYARAMKLGSKSLRQPTDEFYGDRCCGFVDPGGNHWWVAKRL